MVMVVGVVTPWASFTGSGVHLAMSCSFEMSSRTPAPMGDLACGVASQTGGDAAVSAPQDALAFFASHASGEHGSVHWVE